MFKKIYDLTKDENEKIKNQKTVKAVISVFCGGNYGKSGEYIAEIIPKFFKNGKIKHGNFSEIKEIEILKKWYAFRTAKIVKSIKEIEI